MKEKTCEWFNTCSLKKFYEEGKLAKRWIENYCFGDNSRCIRKKMEEQGRYHPDNMLPNGEVRKNLK